ncbi:MAG: gamma-glutamyltransferase, partial [Parvibaculum sp.]|uniref:gamma-glutamyltransferase n=1 Tax=Parvibaculum sp. TaxID=2024848 RepID=UPI003C71C170
YGLNGDISRPSTSHFSIIDAQGRVVSMTTSIEAPFGSHLMAAGLMLNNQLTDFSFVPEENGAPVANAIAPGKRPLSAMDPVIVFDDKGAFFAAIGSPGGSRIIGYVTQTLIALLDWHMPMQEAIALPRFVDRNGPLEIEKGTTLEKLVPQLKQLGHEVKEAELRSGLHGIRVTPTGLDGGADPRRDGTVATGTLAKGGLF